MRSQTKVYIQFEKLVGDIISKIVLKKDYVKNTKSAACCLLLKQIFLKKLRV